MSLSKFITFAQTSNIGNVTAVRISDNPVIGQEVSVRFAQGWSDSDIQWYRCERDGSNVEIIPGQTGATYTTTTQDYDKSLFVILTRTVYSPIPILIEE